MATGVINAIVVGALIVVGLVLALIVRGEAATARRREAEIRGLDGYEQALADDVLGDR
jgi:hypothetical protein